MKSETIFVYNGIKYDTERFLNGQHLFKKITLDEEYHFDQNRPPFLNDAIVYPLVMQYEGRMIVVACSNSSNVASGIKSKEVRLVTKHTLKSFVHQEHLPQERVIDYQRPWQTPRRNNQQRPYQQRGNNSSRRY